MATSGRINGTYAGGSSYQPYLKWSVTQSAANNRSTMSVTFGMRKVSANSSSWSGYDTALTIKVNGTTYTRYITFDYRDAAYPTDHDIVTVSGIEIAHNVDGTKSVTLSATHVTGISLATGSVSGTATLTTIPRASTMTVPTSLTMGTAYTFPIQAAASTFTHSISWRFKGQSGTLTGNTWTPEEGLAQLITDKDNDEGVLTLTTYNGNTAVGSNNYSFTLYCPESMVPTAELTQLLLVQDAAIPGGWDVAVKGFTALSYQVNASGVQGSTISSVQFSCGGVTASGASGTTGVLTAAGAQTPTVTVTDSRGRSATVTGADIEVYDYGLPTIVSSAAYRCDAQGAASNEGTYVHVLCNGSVSPVGGHNTMTRRCRVRPVGGSWGAYTALNDNAGRIIAGFDPSLSYEVEVGIVDSLGSERTVVYSIPTAAVAFNLRAGGTGAAFGKYAEHDKALELPGDWNIRFGNKTLLELVYPVGSIYMSVSSAGPAGLFGGTWERIEDRFLLAAGDTYSAGDTDGEASHTLTVNEMPSHGHSAETSENGAHRHQYGYGSSSGSRAADGTMWNTAGNSKSASEPDAGKNTTQSGAHTHTVTIGNTGDGLAHNNMPPYLVVYVWKRTA